MAQNLWDKYVIKLVNIDLVLFGRSCNQKSDKCSSTQGLY
jgi:hypothetical protein